jgi:hypothetical protein
MSSPVEKRRTFHLKDVMDEKVTLDVEVKCDGNGITIRPIGYGEFCSTDGHGAPILIELQNGVPSVYIWADINQEDFTHKVTLENAAENKRKEDDNG